jgi:hypothetical protein
MAPRKAVGQSIVSRRAFLAPDAERAQHAAEAIDPLRQLAVGPAAARIDIDRLVGTASLEVAPDDVGGEIVGARDRVERRTGIDLRRGRRGDVGKGHRLQSSVASAGDQPAANGE